MSPKAELVEILRLAEEARATAGATLEGMTPEQLSWSPSRDRWSAALIADHLERSNLGAIPKFEEALRAAPAAAGDSHPEYNWLERTMIRTLSPGSKVRVPVPPLFEPKPPADARAAVAGFLAAHEGLVAVANAAAGKDLRGQRITSPANRLVRLRFLPYLKALVQHERYHLEQVKALIEEPGFPR